MSAPPDQLYEARFDEREISAKQEVSDEIAMPPVRDVWELEAADQGLPLNAATGPLGSASRLSVRLEDPGW